MDKNLNRPNKGKNKFNPNQFNPMNFHNQKRISPIPLQMNYQIPNSFVTNEEYIANQPYQIPNMYPIQMPMPQPQNKEQKVKNMFRMYHQYGAKKQIPPYSPPENINLNMRTGDNEMSLEDNVQNINMNKKFNNLNMYKSRIPRKRKNFKNKDIISNNYVEAGQSNNRAISSENNLIREEDLEAYYNENINKNNYGQKGGRKKATTVEYNRQYNYRKNKNKKGFKKYKRQKYNEEPYSQNYSEDNNSNDEQNNIKPYNNDLDIGSNVDNNNENMNYSNEEEFEEDEKNSQDIEILEDEDKSVVQKEVLDLKNINLMKKPDNSENEIIIKSSFSENKSSKKNKIIPELDQMCSEKEMAEREKEKDIDRLEIDEKAYPANKGKKERMIQKYKRKNGKLLNLNDPKEIRNIQAINRTIDYLIEQVLDCDKTGAIKLDVVEITHMDIIDFISDRFTAIYKTIELLKENDITILNDCNLIEHICKMIRTIIIFFNICLDYFDQQSPKKINSLIDNLLVPLLVIIKDIIKDESKYEYNFSPKEKDEFISYYLFIKLKKERKNFGKYYNEVKDFINMKDESIEKIELVHEIYNILTNKNYEKFIDILRNNENCDYLFACFMSLFFKEINVGGLLKLSSEHKEMTYRQLFDRLAFEETDEIREFLLWYGISKDKSRYVVNDSDTVPIFLKNKNQIFDYDKAPQKTNKRYIEKKLGDKLRKDIVSTKIELMKNDKYNKEENISDNHLFKTNEEKVLIKNTSLLSDISKGSKGKSNQNNTIVNNEINIMNNSNSAKDLNNDKEKRKEKDINSLDASFISKRSFNSYFPSSDHKQNTNLNLKKENSNKSERKITSSSKDDFLKPLSPKNTTFKLDKQNSNISLTDNNKSLDLFSNHSISSIEGAPKYFSIFNDEAVTFFFELACSIINKIISDRKLDFMYRLKFIVEKYKIKLELIENYINRRKFFVFNELKKCCLNKKYTKEYYKELVNYNNNLNSENTNENTAFKINNQDLINDQKFELFTYDDIIYFLIKDYQTIEKKEEEEKKEEQNNLELINHLQINIYTTKDLIKSTKIISSLKLKKKLIKENSDASELTIIDNNININPYNKLSLIIKFIFVDQIIDLDSYIYDNQKNISKYSILIPFFDIIKSDPENQQILTKFFTILDIGLGAFIKKDIIFFFIKRDIEQNSELFKDYQNIQNDFIFNLVQKYSNNKNEIIFIDEDYEKNKEIKEKIIYLSPIDEFGKCYQEYIKYLNNKSFAELFENNKIFHLNSFNPKEKLIALDKHIYELDSLINNYINIIEIDLQKYLVEINCINYFYNNKLCIEILIGFIMCKILLIYYQYICLSFANELFKIPFSISNNELLILEDNLLNSGSIFKQINLDGYNKLWIESINLDNKKKKNLISYFDIFCEIICSYNLISDIDMQSYEYAFRKQYYDINLETKNYEIAKNFVNYFNKIITKFVSNNNLNIRNNHTSEILEKIYNKNKLTLLNNISKIITNNSICFNEGTIYIKGFRDLYHGLEKAELLESNKNLNLSKKRKRNDLVIDTDIINNDYNVYNYNKYENKRKNDIKLFDKKVNINKNEIKFNKYKHERKKISLNINKNLKENYNIGNNMIDINESTDKNSKLSSFLSNNYGDINDDYYKSFRTVKKYDIPKMP